MKKISFCIRPFSITNGEPEFNLENYIFFLSFIKRNSLLFSFSLNNVCHVYLANKYFYKLSHYSHEFRLQESNYDRVIMGNSYFKILSSINTYKHDTDFVAIHNNEKYVYIFISPHLLSHIYVANAVNLMLKAAK